MGMFDTFKGKIRCPYCGEIHEFEEQTKKYERMLHDFFIGDYVNESDDCDIYKFQVSCYKYKQEFNGNIIIFNSQVIDVVNDYELMDIDMYNIHNIEEGLGRRLIYEDDCSKGIGSSVDTIGFRRIGHIYEDSNWKKHPQNVGDKLCALKNDWYITDIYKETLKKEEDEISWISRIHFRDNYIYRVKGNLGNRFIKVEEDRLEIFYDNGIKEYDYNTKNEYCVSSSCELVKLS
jgi:hypothetical protein